MQSCRLCPVALIAFAAFAQQPPAKKAPPSEVAGIPVNYDESKTGAYKLPDPLVTSAGKPVRDTRTWTNTRRQIGRAHV